MRLVLGALALAVPAGVGVGVWASTRPRPAAASLATAGVIFTIPSLALFGLLIPPLGLGFRPAVATLALYALLPILRNTVVGLQSVAPDAVDAARGMGMTPWQMLARVRFPLALPVIVAGVRVATVMIVGIATIAAKIAAGGLGLTVFDGLNSGDRTQILAGTLLITGIALAIDALLSAAERALRRRDRTGAPAPADVEAVPARA